MLTFEQGHALLRRSVFWIQVIEEYSLAPDPLPTRSTIERAHFLTVALEHLASCAKHLRTDAAPELRHRLVEYVEAWGGVRDVRNLLEHEEEYLTGGGNNRGLLPPGAPQLSRGVVWAGFAQTALSIDVLGVSLNIRPHVGAAKALKADLLAWLTAVQDTNTWP
jgi:hypothetical protein